MMVELRLAHEYQATSIAMIVVFQHVHLQGLCGGAIEIAGDLQAVFVLNSLGPMLVPLILTPELAMAGLAPDVLLASLKMHVHLSSTAECHQARQTRELVANNVVVFVVIAQTVAILEGTKADVAGDIVADSIVHMVLKTVTILEYACAQIAVVLVLRSMLGVIDQESFACERYLTNAAPVVR
jgi:hypothetical protein